MNFKSYDEFRLQEKSISELHCVLNELNMKLRYMLDFIRTGGYEKYEHEFETYNEKVHTASRHSWNIKI